MTTPMSDKRLAAITDHCERRTENPDAAESWDDMAPDYAVELLDEVDRLRAERAEMQPEWATRVTNRATGREEVVPQPSEDSARRRAGRESTTSVLVTRLVGQWHEPTGGAR